MLKKTLLTISLLLPFAAMSGLAQAGSTITDKSYWPNEAQRTVVPSGDWRSARASMTRPPQYDVAPSYSRRGSGWTYQGGPRSPMTRAPQF